MTTNVASRKQADQESVLQPVSIPSIDGYFLSEVPLVPLTYQSTHLANTKETFLWVDDRDGKPRDCFLHRNYGEIAPNADTIDYLYLLIRLLLTSDDPYTIKTNFHELITLKPFRKGYKPNKQYKDAVIRHLDALHLLFLNTNASYNPERKRWRTVRTNILNYDYEDETGKVRKRRIRKRLDDGTPVVIESHESISELADITLSKPFVDHFLDSKIHMDHGIYFALENPTPKGVWRFSNGRIQTHGGYIGDLKHVLVNKVGMSRNRIESTPKFSRIVQRIKPHLQRINETDDRYQILIERNPSFESGYRFIADRSSNQVSFFPTLESFTERERKAYRLLHSYGVFPNASASLIRHYRKRLGREAPDYIQFVVKRFKEKYVKTGLLRTPQSKWGGVLHNFFKCDLYFAEYGDWAQQRKSRRRRDDQSMYDQNSPIQQLAAQIGSAFSQSSNPSQMTDHSPGRPASDVLASKHIFSLQQFEHDHSELYQRIVEAATSRYDQAKIDFPAGLITDAQLEKKKQEAIEFYCKQCFDEFKKGNADYFPPILADDE